jgi:hypothetical protein
MLASFGIVGLWIASRIRRRSVSATKKIVLAAVFIVAANVGTLRASAIPGYYVADDAGKLWRVNVTSGATTLIGNMGLVLFDIAFSPNGDLYGVSSSSLYQVDSNNGGTTLIGSLGLPSPAASGLAFRSDGILFLADAPTVSSGTLYTVDTSTGLASSVGPIGYASNGDLAFDSSGNLFMAASNFTTQFNLVSVNSTTGNGSIIGPHGFGSLPAIDFVGADLIGVNRVGQIITLNTTTGVGQLVTTTSPLIAATGASYLVPEPGTISLAMIAVGCFTLLACLRRSVIVAVRPVRPTGP